MPLKRLLVLGFALLLSGGAFAQVVANGVFLIAQPTLTEATFRRTVILITQRPDGGSLGVIINRPSDVPLREAFPQHEHIAVQPQPVYFGGPVQPQSMMFVVRSSTPPPTGVAVLRDVYLTGDADWVNNALATGKVLTATRAFAGYAGWAPGQLRSEMERQGWYILPADSETLFDAKPDGLWAELVRRAVLRPTEFRHSPSP